MSVATVDDVKGRSLRPLVPAEEEWLVETLPDVWAMVVNDLPDIQSRIDGPPADANLQRLAVQVQVAAVLRVLRNPDGVLEESGDDYRRRLDAAVSTGQLYVSASEIERLRGSSGSSSAAFTISPWAGRPSREPDWWHPL